MPGELAYCYNVPLSLAGKWWPMIEPWVAEGLRHNTYGETLEDMRGLLDAPETLLQLWMRGGDPVGCLILELTEERCLHVTMVSGDLDLAVNLDLIFGELVHIARMTGNRSIAGIGRKGWRRRLARLGFECDDGHYRRGL